MLTLSTLENVEAVAIHFFKSLNISGVNPAEIVNELNKHPDYSSLLSVSDILTHFGVENFALRIDSAELKDIQCPFIAQAPFSEGEFVVVHKIEGTKISLSNEIWQRKIVSTNEFLALFSGVVLIAQMQQKPTWTLNNLVTKIFQKQLLLLSTSITVVLCALFLISSDTRFTLRTVSLLFTIITGLVTSILLLVQSIDSANPFIARLCGNHEKVNCNSVLSSSAAKIFSWLSWSEVGFFYFAGSLVLLMFNDLQTKSTYQVLLILNVISLPYTFYSVYYQAFVAKQWCVFCCVVQATLWIEFVCLLPYFEFLKDFSSDITLKLVCATFLSFVTPIVIWNTVKPLIKEVRQLNPLKKQLQKIKYNQDVFNQFLSKKIKYMIPEQWWSIVLGNKDEPRHTITLVSNPLCEPCARIHRSLDKLLVSRNDIQVRVIFNTRIDEHDPRFQITKHFMSLRKINNDHQLHTALSTWYSSSVKKLDVLQSQYPINVDIDVTDAMQNQRSWCDMVELAHTPSIFINGQELPEVYDLDDLQYLLEYD